jgi:hypothetical protein
MIMDLPTPQLLGIAIGGSLAFIACIVFIVGAVCYVKVGRRKKETALAPAESGTPMSTINARSGEMESARYDTAVETLNFHDDSADGKESDAPAAATVAPAAAMTSRGKSSRHRKERAAKAKSPRRKAKEYDAAPVAPVASVVAGAKDDDASSASESASASDSFVPLPAAPRIRRGEYTLSAAGGVEPQSGVACDWITDESTGGDKKWLLKRGDLKVGRELGRGAFARVMIAKLRGERVALKQLLVDEGGARAPTEKELAAFIKEAQLMQKLPPHPNVVQLKGVLSDVDVPMGIVTEFCGGGSLDSYLKARACTLLEKIDILLDVAEGLYHLHRHNIVHRDLAVRNLLLSADGTVKVADFGMSRDTVNDGNTTKSNMGPLRWMSIESLRSQQFSTRSDIWSYGITAWEVFEDAKLPYEGLSPAEVCIRVVRDNLRLSRPAICPGDVFDFLRKCWFEQPSERPSVKDVILFLEAARERIAQSPSAKLVNADFNVGDDESTKESTSD